MPVTPLHFGPGALFKAVAPHHVNWTVFALANVLIDVEPVALFLLTGDPAHPWLHTLAGALLVAACAATCRPACEAWLRFWNRRLSLAQHRWLRVDARITVAQARVGALVGTSSHLALDALMHADVRPLWPILPGNPWRGAVSMDALYWGCVLAAVLALPFWRPARDRGS